jgi:hypothetical protein
LEKKSGLGVILNFEEFSHAELAKFAKKESEEDREFTQNE